MHPPQAFIPFRGTGRKLPSFQLSNGPAGGPSALLNTSGQQKLPFLIRRPSLALECVSVDLRFRFQIPFFPIIGDRAADPLLRSPSSTQHRGGSPRDTEMSQNQVSYPHQSTPLAVYVSRIVVSSIPSALSRPVPVPLVSPTPGGGGQQIASRQ